MGEWLLWKPTLLSCSLEDVERIPFIHPGDEDKGVTHGFQVLGDAQMADSARCVHPPHPASQPLLRTPEALTVTIHRCAPGRSPQTHCSPSRGTEEPPCSAPERNETVQGNSCGLVAEMLDTQSELVGRIPQHEVTLVRGGAASWTASAEPF